MAEVHATNVGPAAVDEVTLPSPHHGLLRLVGRAVPVLAAGAVVGIIEVAIAVSFATLIFSGELAVGLGQGIGYLLLGGAAMLAVTGALSSIPATAGSLQDAPAAILAVAAASVAAAPIQGDLVITVVALMAVGGVATGAAFLLVGARRLGDLFRFVPYPIIAGFLAGTGWLLSLGALQVLGAPTGPRTLGAALSADALVRWLPGVVLALVLLGLARRVRTPLLLPAAIVAAGALFYAVLLVSRTPLAVAEARGLLLGPLPAGRLWQPLTPAALSGVDWSVVLGQAGSLGSLVLVSLLALLLNASGLELAAGEDVELNRELRAAGVANVLAGGVGSMSGYHALSLSVLGRRMGADSRAVGVVAAGFCLLALFAGARLLGYFPRALFGGLLLFLGLGFLVEVGYDVRRVLPRVDFALILLILATVALWGFVAGVALGLAAAIVIFVVTYSRTDVVRHAFDGVTIQSCVDRPEGHRDLLLEHGGKTCILELQGYLFFGTAVRLQDRVRQRLDEQPPVRFVVLDLRHVTGVDSSALQTFVRLRQRLRGTDAELVLTGVPSTVAAQLTTVTAGVGDDDFRTFEDLDHGLEHCEDALLARTAPGEEETAPTLEQRLSGSLSPDEIASLVSHLERVEVVTGKVVVRQGEQSDDLYLVERGQLTAWLELDGSQRIRLRRMGPGSVLGEMALYSQGERSATVIADCDAVLHRLPLDTLDELAARRPALGAALHRLVARGLANRLLAANRTLGKALG